MIIRAPGSLLQKSPVVMKEGDGGFVSQIMDKRRKI